MINTEVAPIGISRIDFIGKNVMFLHLTNERTVLVPLDKFKPSADLTSEQREDFEIIDDHYLSFLALDEVYSLKELIGIE